MRAVPVAVAASVLLAAVAWGRPAADFDHAVVAAMAPYYGALAASARGDAESTQRHLVVFRTRWAAATAARASARRALVEDPAWSDLFANIDRAVTRAEALVRDRNVHDAHREIEGVRLALYRLRARHALVTFDDRLTEYHESMERLHMRASMYNEIVLGDADYAEMTQDLAHARSRWATLVREAGPLAGAEGWQAAAARSVAAQDDLARLIAARDEPALARTVETMKDAYLELLDVMSRVAR